MKTKLIIPIIIFSVLVLGIAAVAFLSLRNEVQEPEDTITDTETGGDLEGITVPPPEGRVAAGYIAGHVDIGPFCPVEREGEPCKVPPEAYTSREVVVYGADGNTIVEKDKLDVDGNYKITIGPGTYFVQITPAGIGPGEKKKVMVTSWNTSTVDFDIDTGIR